MVDAELAESGMEMWGVFKGAPDCATPNTFNPQPLPHEKEISDVSFFFLVACLP